jgi:hypothetical protein
MPWLGSIVDGIARYRRALYVVLFCLCSLILISSNQLTLGKVILAAVVGLIGYLIISSITRFAASRRRAEIEASVTAEAAGVQAPVASRPSQPVALDLTEDDAKILHRLATLLREVSSESGAS